MSNHVSQLTPVVPQGAARPKLVWQNRAGVIGLGLLLLSLGLRYTILVQPRAMEFDQISTLIAATARTWHAYLAAVPIDSQPPFSHLAARIGLSLPLPEAIGVHMVSALVTALAAVCIFRLFQRRAAPLAGLCGAALFTASRCVEFMFTVRPYAALMAITALGVLVYDTYRIRRAAGRPAPLWPLALVLLLSATIHALSLVYVCMPIVTGELLHWHQTRRVDTRLLVAVGLASPAFLFDFALARYIATHYMSQVPLSARTPALPAVAKLYEVMAYPVERRWQTVLFALVLAGTVFLWRNSHVTGDSSSTPDLLFPFLAAAAVYFAAILAFCIGVANHYFFTRYASPVFVAGALLFGALLSTSPWQRFPAVPLAIAAVLLVLPLPALVTFVRNGPHTSPQAEYAAIFQHGDVVASPIVYPTLWWYATPQERTHLRMVTDPDHYRTVPDGISEAVLRWFARAGVLPFPLTSYRDLHPGDEVYLVRPDLSGDTWLPGTLESHGFTCALDTSFRSQSYALDHCVRTHTTPTSPGP
ncbi:hypothetical protein [Terriglobus sp.]|uniref:hypothetical protein n=1 Tax=Terriglobus sp. TaxID=1889013 RepID=UPI003B007030